MVSAMDAICWDLGKRGAIFKGSLATPYRTPVPNWLLHFKHGDKLSPYLRWPPCWPPYLPVPCNFPSGLAWTPAGNMISTSVALLRCRHHHWYSRRRQAAAKLLPTSRCCTATTSTAAAAAVPPFVGWLLCCCLPSNFVIACHHATVIALVAGHFCQ